ncbi:GAF domain-containing protein [Trujillonella humicola]|uniref:GAF domain-containing protein n=1 Tax=Trujillonella humicola TaxID=3383699 RepID=UPI003905C9A4
MTDVGGPDGPLPDRGRLLEELTRISLRSEPLSAVLRRVALLACDTVPGAVAASVTLVEGRRVRSMGVTDRRAAALDERQYDRGFGPCLEAAVTGEPVLVEDTAEEPVYPEFAAVARRLGIGRVLSVGMPVDHRVVGSLNLYGGAGRWGAGDVAVARDPTLIICLVRDFHLR